MKSSSPTPCERFLADLIDTLIEAGFSKREAKAEVAALVKWAAQETA